MDASSSNLSISQRRAAQRELWLQCALFIAFMLVVEGPLRAIGHGGIVSFVQALAAARAKAQRIEVDESGLRLAFASIACLVVTVVCAWLKVNLGKRLVRSLIVALIFGIGFIGDAIYGGLLIGYCMNAHGYSRCISGDRAIGNGKGRVYLNSYVLVSANCPSSS